jgi:Divergent InlB B-repeat domain
VWGVDGTTALANFSGVEVLDNGNLSSVVASDITIRTNVIANNTGLGVAVHRSTNLTNTVLGIIISKNIIRNNTGLPIDLYNGAASDGVTANDALDVDTGANNLQNYPVLTTATGNGTTVATPYSVNSEPNKNFTLEFFQATACNASGHGGADVYLGTVNVVTDASGNASGTASFASALVSGFINATATNIVNGTSEFSICAPLSGPLVNVLLTVTKSGTGSGTVTGIGITCGADCSESLAQNSVVVLSAAATVGSTFIGWSGGGCSGTSTCSVTLTAAQTVNAQFNITPVANVTLSVTQSGTGLGTITGPGINCGADCSEPFALGTVVTLTATANAGNVFIGWSGGGCSGTGTCVLTIAAAPAPATVNAQFAAAPPPIAAVTVPTLNPLLLLALAGLLACGARRRSA